MFQETSARQVPSLRGGQNQHQGMLSLTWKGSVPAGTLQKAYFLHELKEGLILLLDNTGENHLAQYVTE